MAGAPTAGPAAAAPPLSPEERAAARRERERQKHASARAEGREPSRNRAQRRASHGVTATPRTGRPPKVSVAQIAEALGKTGGLIGISAQLLKVERRTVERYLTKYASLRTVRDQAKESALDHAEWSLIRAAKAGEPWAVQWFLRYQGKARGYQDVRKTEQESTVRVEVAYTDDALASGHPATTVTQLPPPSADEADPSHYEPQIEVVEAEVLVPEPAP